LKIHGITFVYVDRKFIRENEKKEKREKPFTSIFKKGGGGFSLLSKKEQNINVSFIGKDNLFVKGHFSCNKRSDF